MYCRTENGKMYVKDWFENKIVAPSGYWIDDDEMRIYKETEKAYLVIISVDCAAECGGCFQTWIPKSCLMTEEEHQAVLNERQARFEAGCDKYNKLIDWCKAHSIKGVRNGLRTSTIMKKIADAGLVYAE